MAILKRMYICKLNLKLFANYISAVILLTTSAVLLYIPDIFKLQTNKRQIFY